MTSRQNFIPRSLQGLFEPVDAAVLAYFRVAFGLVMAWHLLKELFSGGVHRDYIQPVYHFTYPGLEWVRPLPATGMEIVFLILVAACLGIAAGLFQRAAAAVFTLGYTYLFLIDQAYYLNHSYFICLLGLTLTVIPANVLWSLDTRRNPSLSSDVLPAWTLWLLRFHIALPYFFGGIAKLNPDWLRGQPMRSWLPESPLPHLLGSFGGSWELAMFMSWSGMLFDLLVVPALLWQRTRWVALAAAVLFHLTNAIMLDIGVFPWLMIAATLVFFPPDWPRNLPGLHSTSSTGLPEMSGRTKALTLSVLCVYATLHCLLPLRHFAYPGDASWTDQGHDFAWRMMLRDKDTALQFVVKDGATGKLAPVDLSNWLSVFQIEAMGHDPELMRQFAEFLGQQLRDRGDSQSTVHVIAIASLNGRKPQFLIDPRVDLARANPRHAASYLVPLRQPFREPPWDVPVADWLQNVDNAEWIEELRD